MRSLSAKRMKISRGTPVLQSLLVASSRSACLPSTLAASSTPRFRRHRDMEIYAAQLRFEVAPHRSSATVPEGPVDGPLIQRAHLYASNVSPEFVADAVIFLRARRPGFLRAAFATGWLIVALLRGGYAYLSDITKSTNSTTAGALLLIVPTLMGMADSAGRHG